MASHTLPLPRLFLLISVYDVLAGRSLLVLELCGLCNRDLGFSFATTGPNPFSPRVSVVNSSILETSLILCSILCPGRSMSQDSTAQNVRHHWPSWLAVMVRYTFVTRKGIDLVTDVALSCPCSGVAPHVDSEPDGYRVVFRFFVGQFSLDEIDSFMTYVAASPGTAPVARDHFKTFSPDSSVSTCEISFQRNVGVPIRVQNIIDEYNDVKYIDAFTFECIQAEWSGSVSTLQVVRLSQTVF